MSRYLRRGAALFLALLLTFSLSATALAALPTDWDLSSIYSSADEWQEDYDAAMKLLDGYERFRGKLNNAQTIYDFFEFGYFSELTRLQLKLIAYASLGSSLNSADPVFAELNAKLGAMSVKEQQVSAFAIPEIYSLPLEQRQAIFSDPLFDGLSYYLRDYTNPDKQPLSEEAAEAVATLSMALGYPEEAFERLLYVEIPYPSITMPDGSEQKLTSAAYSDILYSPDCSDAFKKEANRLYYARVMPYVNTLAKLLEGNAKQAYANALLNHYDTTRAAALDNYDVKPQVYDMLIAAAHEGIPAYQRYLSAHARGLGLTEQYSYQLSSYVSSFDPGKTEYEDGVNEVVQALGVLGEEYIDTFNAIMESGHIDVYPAEAKTTGAFETQTSKEFLPWVLFNYNGYSSDVSTIAHEMGHAVYAAYATANQPLAYADPTIFTHEVASTTNELLYYSYKMDHAKDDEERLYYLENVLSMFGSTFFGQMLFAEFEDAFYQTVEAGSALDAETLSDTYAGLLQRYYGSEAKFVEESRYHWASIPHFYYVYYVYQYASSVSYAASIAERIRNGEPGAVESYLAFLKAGNSADPQKLLAIAGIDPLSGKTYDDAMAYFSGLVEEYERMVDAKPAAGSAQPAAAAFADVPADAYYADAVAWAKDKGVTNGKSATAFCPGDPVTRGQAVTFLWRAVGSPRPAAAENAFLDVPAGAYYSDAVAWAAENGIAYGVTQTEFQPEAAVTNAQMLTFLARAAGETVTGSDWQRLAVEWAESQKLLEELPGFAPADSCLRADVVFLLWRAANS